MENFDFDNCLFYNIINEIKIHCALKGTFDRAALNHRVAHSAKLIVVDLGITHPSDIKGQFSFEAHAELLNHAKMAFQSFKSFI